MSRTPAAHRFRRMARRPELYAPSRAAFERDTFRPPEPIPLPAGGDELRRAVIAEPDADGPRLAFADWCDGNGRPERAEFIRRQLRGDDATDLFSRHGNEWLRELEQWGVAHPVFRRGFVEAVRVSGRCLISLADGLFAAAPIHELHVVAVAPFMDELYASDNLRRVRSLSLDGNRLGDAVLSRLADAADHLTELDLRRNGLTGVPWLSRFRRLRSLKLAGNPLAPGWAALLPPSLVALDVPPESAKLAG